jgi:hypothetical protein
MKVKGGLLGHGGGERGEKGGKEKVVGGEYDQTILYAYMEMS